MTTEKATRAIANRRSKCLLLALMEAASFVSRVWTQRYSGQQEQCLLKMPNASAPKKTKI